MFPWVGLASGHDVRWLNMLLTQPKFRCRKHRTPSRQPSWMPIQYHNSPSSGTAPLAQGASEQSRGGWPSAARATGPKATTGSHEERDCEKRQQTPIGGRRREISRGSTCGVLLAVRGVARRQRRTPKRYSSSSTTTASIYPAGTQGAQGRMGCCLFLALCCHTPQENQQCSTRR